MQKLLVMILFLSIANFGHAGTRSCKTFDTQKEAQKYFEARKRVG